MIRAGLFLLLASLMACTNTSGTGVLRIDGTSDSGGGNGADGKAYEAYIVKPETLPAYRTLIAPKIQQLVALSPQPELVMPVIQKWLLYKTWYIAPVQLGAISKDVIGVSFSKDNTEQLAIQTKKSIWINNARFASMSAQDQATLIVHEMVMSLYYLRFKSWQEICAEKIYPEINCQPGQSDILNEMFPGSTPKPFDSNDYENIRTVTGALLGLIQIKSAKELDDLLIGNGFDRRFTYGMGLDGDGQDNRFIYHTREIITMDDFKQVLSSAKLLNRLPDLCEALTVGASLPCGFSFREIALQAGNGFRIPHLQVTTTAADGSFQFSGLRVLMSQEIEGSSLEWVQQKKKMSYFVLNPDPTPTPRIPGTTFRTVTMVTLQDLDAPNPPHTLLGFIAVPGVVTGLTKDRLDCVYAKPSATAPKDDVLLVRSGYLSEFDRQLLGMRAKSFPAATTCRDFED